jgi:lysine/ornithine N-monooxygenase
MKTTDTLIIGAGPYGIGAAQELYDSGVDFTIVGKPFSLWFNHTHTNMSIRSDWHTSEIYSRNARYSFLDFLKRNYAAQWQQILTRRIPSPIFRHYLSEVLQRLPFHVHDSLVESCEQTDTGFTICCADGTVYRARRVVCATGIEAHRFVPGVLSKISSQRIVHTWNIGDIESLCNKRILVVGAGQSAAESVVALVEKDNSVTWLLRHKPVWFNEPINLPTSVFNFVLKISSLYYFLPMWLRRPLAKKFVQSTITPDMRAPTGVEQVTMRFGDIQELPIDVQENAITVDGQQYDYLVCATGYRYDIDNLGFVSPSLRALIHTHNGIPKLNYDFCTSVDGLYMIGGISEPAYGPAQRFIMGSTHAAQRIGKVIRRRSGAGTSAAVRASADGAHAVSQTA